MFTINFTLRDSTGRITDYFETTCTGNNSCVPDPEAGKLHYILHMLFSSLQWPITSSVTLQWPITYHSTKKRQRHILYLK